MKEQETVRSFLASVSVGEPLSFEQLALYPLWRKEAAPFSCITLDEAMARGSFHVEEVDGGTVALLLVVNDTAERVFLMDGEELVGARQNRILNLSLLVERSSELKVPVSCVEQGRWVFSGARAMRAANLSHPSLRGEKAAQVHQSLRERRSFESDQGQVWNSVHYKLCQADSPSPTGALEAAFEHNRAKLDKYSAALSCPEGAVGVAAVIAGSFVCADIFATPALLSSLWQKLVHSFALDALDAPSTGWKLPAAAEIEGELALPEDAVVEPFDAPGLGVSVRLRTGRTSGSALVVDGTAVHVEIFAPQGGQGASRLSRPSQRAPR
jgi:hypothetical protein